MIAITDHDSVRELRLNRPPANALSAELMAALREAVERAPAEGAKAIVLSGSPGMFSAGLDVPHLLTLDRQGIAAAWQELYALLHGLAASPVPIAAAITGHAPAGGTVLALYCDWRVVASGEWRLGFTEVQVGLPLPPIILAALQRQVGFRTAENLSVRGLLVNPAKAAELRVVDEVVPPEQVVSSALQWCRELVNLPPNAMQTTRRHARADLVALFDRDLDRERDAMIAHWWSEETQQVLRAVAARLAKKGATQKAT